MSVSSEINILTAGINDNEPEAFTLYPNPFSNEVTIVTNTTAGLCAITITDISGRSLYTDTLESRNRVIDLSLLPDGIYVVQLRNSKGTSAKKLIKRK
ncbi:MAG: T9SS type A sorting domain-containing protein [Bacteroidales bacterium]|nr:T9SS type A sorting domain-containing protein [Bacteroidales bacterium]